MRAPTKWIRPNLSVRATCGEAFVGNMRAAIEQVAANAAGAAAGRDPEYLHQLRVGVRRLRSTLRAFRELLRRGRADAIEAPWRSMMRALGTARDWDVFHHSLGQADLRAEARKHRGEAQRKAGEHLQAQATLQRAADSARASSPPRPNTNGSPPLSRTTRRPRRAARIIRR